MPKSKFRIIILGTLLLIVAVFLFSVFRTDAFIDGSDIEAMAGNDTAIYSKERNIRQSQEVVAGVFKAEDTEVSGETQKTDDVPGEPEDFTGNSVPTQGSSYSNIRETDMYKNLTQKCSVQDEKACSCAVAYNAVMSKYNNESFAWGIMMNVYHEGRVSEVEHNGRPIANWNGDNVTASSTDSSPLFVSSLENCKAMQALPYSESSSTPAYGVGIIQWTRSRMHSIMLYYEANANGDYSKENLTRIEIDFLLNELETSYAGVVTTCTTDNMTPEECTEYITKTYIRPGNTNVVAKIRRDECLRIRQLIQGGT